MLKKIALVLVAVFLVFSVYSYFRYQNLGPGEETTDWSPNQALDPVLWDTVAPGRDITLYTSSQGWSEDLHTSFWHMDQGSLLTPYDIFLQLNTADQSQLFRSASNIASFRYLPATVSDSNPDGLPIGFTKTENEWQGQNYLGMTCSACHSGVLIHDNQALMIQGAPTHADFQSMSEALSASLTTAYEDQDAFDSLASRMGVTDENDKQALRQRVENAAIRLSGRIELMQTPLRYGFGRLDAVGEIYNSVTVANLQEPKNISPPSAPVSYPFIWGTGQSDVVQWTGFAPNYVPGGMLVRNVGEVLGVFGIIEVEDEKKFTLGYKSTVNVENLGTLESWVNTLEPPAWPTGVFGPIDVDSVAKGAAIYKAECAECHEVVTPFQTYKAKLIKGSEVGTDLAAMNTTLETVKTVDNSDPDNPTVKDTPKLEILVKQSVGAILNQPKAAIEAGAAEDIPDQFAKAGSDTYKARPLNAIWATPPYLHNGSVPTLHDLLLPVDQRPTSFAVGGWDFDPVKVGLLPYTGADAFTIDTTLPGNLNTGHTYGTQLSEDDRMALIAYLKTL